MSSHFDPTKKLSEQPWLFSGSQTMKRFDLVTQHAGYDTWGEMQECDDGEYVLAVDAITPVARMEWLEDMHTLHGTVEILYVVDGYQLTYMYHDCEIAKVHGATLNAAIDTAISKGWRPKFRAGEVL